MTNEEKDGFLAKVCTKDAYIALMEDLIAPEIEAGTPILQSEKEKLNATDNARIIDNALKDSCNAFQQADNFGVKDLRVGSAPKNEIGYVEPCPIQYTGILKNDKKIFHCVFVGLNPHLEPWKTFPHHLKKGDLIPSRITFADLANFHHPNDIRFGCSADKYGPEGVIRNNYWRVMGNMEEGYNGAWSSFYKDVVRIYLALLPSKAREVYETFDKMIQKQNLTKYLLEKMADYPIANLELIPYKSKGINIKKIEKVLNNYNNDFLTRYNKYFFDLMTFVDNYALDDAYIIATVSVKGGKGSTPALDALYRILKKHVIHEDISQETINNEFFVYNKSKKKLEQNKKKNSYDLAPMYLFNWNNRKVILTSPISSNNNYGWIYRDFRHGWIDAIKKHFEDDAETHN